MANIYFKHSKQEIFIKSRIYSATKRCFFSIKFDHRFPNHSYEIYLSDEDFPCREFKKYRPFLKEGSTQWAFGAKMTSYRAMLIQRHFYVMSLVENSKSIGHSYKKDLPSGHLVPKRRRVDVDAT